MTGKYAGTSEPVVVTDDMDTEFTSRLEGAGIYDSGQDVEFTPCEDGLVIDVPVTGGALSRHILTVSSNLFVLPTPFMAALKVIHDGRESSELKMSGLAKTILAGI